MTDRRLTGVSMMRSDFCRASTSPRDGGVNLDLTVDDDLALETTVVVDCPIPVGSRSLPLTIGLYLRRLLYSGPMKRVIRATLDHGTMVLLGDPSSRQWVKLVRVARDCHEQNVRLTRVGEDCLILETNQNIRAGEELFVWYATDMLFELAIPFLSPGQILGQQHYSCVACGAVYLQPNPLKAHIILACRSRFQPDTINANSERLSDGLVAPGNDGITSLNCSRLPETVPIASSQCQKYLPVKCCHDMFPPSKANFNPNVLRLAATEQSTNLSSLQKPLSESLYINPSSSQERNVNSRNHCCVYCGKEYSRKYGLKIHVRTHTGYKPLKCKYCHRPFSDPSNLNKHVRLHADASSPYHCSLCGKILVRRRDLERHLRSRHGLLSQSDVAMVTETQRQETHDK